MLNLCKNVLVNEMNKRQAEALQELEKYTDWYLKQYDEVSDSGKIIVAGLTRDILTANDMELTRLLDALKLRNHRAVMKKLAINT